MFFCISLSHTATADSLITFSVTKSVENSIASLESGSKISAAEPIQTEPLQRRTSILLNHWHKTAQDPPHFRDQLIAIEHYYFNFPEIRQLLAELKGLPWKISFRQNQFSTSIAGSQSHVESAIIHIDTGAGNRYRFNRLCKQKPAHCIASPADVLLHELIHTHLALTESKSFLSLGGLGGQLYPFAHEHQVISIEQRIFRSMTQKDQRPRPYRVDHVGAPIQVACVTCIQ